MSLQRDTSFDLSAARERLAGLSGRAFWKSLEELAGSETFQEWLGRAYPSQTHRFLDPPSRREALKLMAASLALAGVSSCTRQPKETIVPYARSPEATIPGVPLYYATAPRIYEARASVLVMQAGKDVWSARSSADGPRGSLIPTYEKLFSSEVVLDGALFRLKFDGSSNKAVLAAVRGTYSFTKRTAVYAMAGRISNDGALALSVSSVPGTAPVAGDSQTGVAMGVRHSF